ncbi:MAG: GNAT family N-acetyltransferase [Muribaculaceae bacterium]|nr:GNAT family N-acetyltransferase [Muribaculaceae bacterium]
MNEIEIKEGMMRLWKETFHDSEEYVSLVFDAFFNIEMVEYEERDGHIVAALLAVPYYFGNSRHQLKGLYLCGLSTEPAYRKQGIMGALIERLASRMKNSGHSFMFLIPADEGLQRYYRDRRFVNAFYRSVERFTSSHDFALDNQHALNEEDSRIKNIKQRYCERLICRRISAGEELPVSEARMLTDYIRNRENSGSDSCRHLGIQHTACELMAAIKECFVSGGRIYYCINSDEKVSGVGFVYAGNDEVTVYCLHVSDRCSYYRLLGGIKNDFPDLGLKLYSYPVRNIGGISDYDNYSPARNYEVYGMARILNLYEILKFQTEERHDLKYSILVKNEENNGLTRFVAENGFVSSSQLKPDTLSPNQLLEAMDEREVASILFRRPDSDHIVEEVLEIPPLGGCINLMLD